MIVEQRVYTLKVGRVAEFLSLYATSGLHVHERNLGVLLGYFVSETGELNQVIHLWAYRSPEDREARRAALNADPEWLAFSATVSDLFLKMETRLLRPAAFFAPRLEAFMGHLSLATEAIPRP